MALAAASRLDVCWLAILFALARNFPPQDFGEHEIMSFVSRPLSPPLSSLPPVDYFVGAYSVQAILSASLGTTYEILGPPRLFMLEKLYVTYLLLLQRPGIATTASKRSSATDCDQMSGLSFEIALAFRQYMNFSPAAKGCLVCKMSASVTFMWELLDIMALSHASHTATHMCLSGSIMTPETYGDIPRRDLQNAHRTKKAERYW